MGQLTGGVGHDFNNLLTPIMSTLNRLQEKGLGDDVDWLLVDSALQSAERARTLVQRLLAFARKQPLPPTAIEVGDLVTSITGPQIQVRVETERDLLPALADANQIEMAVLNLAINARDAMPEGGTLCLAVTNEIVGPEQRLGRGPRPLRAPGGRRHRNRHGRGHAPARH